MDLTIYIDGETGDLHGSTDEFTIDSIPNPDDPTDPTARLAVAKGVLEVSAPSGVDFQWAASFGSEALRALSQRKPRQATAMYAKVTLRARPS